MRRTLLFVVVPAVILASCTSRLVDPSASLVATGPPRLGLHTWCGDQSPARCIEGLAYLDSNPEQEECVLSTRASDRAFGELCAEPGSPTEPVTTIPTSESEAQRLAEEEAFRERMEQRLPVLDARAAELLRSTHPDDTVEVGLVFTEPLKLPVAEQIVAGFGAGLIAAWRTDYVCLPGWEELPLPAASRYAYLDGVERAAGLQQEMDNSTTPVTGRHIPMNSFAVMEQEALALREPGVLLEAVRAEVPIGVIDALTAHPKVSQVRIVNFPIDWLDSSKPPVPDCPAD